MAVGPAQLLQRLQECPDARLSFGIVRGQAKKHTDAPHVLRLLRPRPNGHAVAPPSPAMKARLLIFIPPERRARLTHGPLGR